MLRLPRPSHQQIPFYRILLLLLRILLPQSLNTLKAKPQQSLFGSKGIKFLPVHTSNHFTHITLTPKAVSLESEKCINHIKLYKD